MTEEIQSPKSNLQSPIIKIDKNQLVDFQKTPPPAFTRLQTQVSEFDRVLGGGIVVGSLILLGGEPGIGKSTLLLEVAQNIANCFYISAEESLEQIKIRSVRLGQKIDSLNLAAEGDLESIEREIIKRKPALVIVDSIQTVYLTAYPSTPG
ncbi:MAG: AAA family ATPase, partial [Candidatus Parcubacteria bacterium]|nr:AAA family ATPase [Candidatus Parcubacteria bacterium]